jgi:hypothetical protein
MDARSTILSSRVGAHDAVRKANKNPAMCGVQFVASLDAAYLRPRQKINQPPLLVPLLGRAVLVGLNENDLAHAVRFKAPQLFRESAKIAAVRRGPAR